METAMMEKTEKTFRFSGVDLVSGRHVEISVKASNYQEARKRINEKDIKLTACSY